ncbi:UDP-N-acetylglucosamine 2-epimerase [Desulfobacterota bacterium AH_259_B03_O07]|nr:UDP-N-acetylglucosamine 2-epimerase [Desulfobacterota bacterium AH_259_B03_O07]
MRKIVTVTGSRGEYGYIRPIIREIQRADELDYSIIVTNIHLLPDFGFSIDEIERDGLKIGDRIYMALDGYTPASMSKSLGVFLMSVTDVLARIKPDIVLLAGDRGEQLMTAIAAAHMNIPVAHIQAGELSGNIDGMARHAITRFTHIHFASGEDAAKRLLRMGEQEFRIYLTGAPQLDELVNGDYAHPEEIAGLFRLDLNKPIILLVQHPVTEEYEESVAQVRETLEAICSLGFQTVAIFPNNDAGNMGIRRLLEQYRRPFLRVERNVHRHIFTGLMNISSVMVGNSSSALIEAPCFKLPAVNIGTRQRGRQQGNNVIDVNSDRHEVKAAIEQALSPKLRRYLQENCENPYLGDGRVSQRIVQILKTITITEELLKKQISY